MSSKKLVTKIKILDFSILYFICTNRRGLLFEFLKNSKIDPPHCFTIHTSPSKVMKKAYLKQILANLKKNLLKIN
jgi:hypothetical protein